ncbi:MAG TPA: asparaginase [Vicinamibacterales bacterium]|nr:asparaginase [Vicinamibacterales bacterium]
MRRRAASAFLAVLTTIALSPAPSAAGAEQATAALPRVRLIATGGTISNAGFGRLSAAQLVDSVPGLERHVRAESEQFSNVPSTALSLDQWLELARHINVVLSEDLQLAGVVVTGGTDTLEELAYFLNLTIRSERPVVLVGSMRPPSNPGYDGTANLLSGFRVAADAQSRGRGVLVVLNDEIHAAREVVKTEATGAHAFRSRGYGRLGLVGPDRVVYGRQPEKRHTLRSEFDVARIAGLPQVEIVLVYQAATGQIIRALADSGIRGIVVGAAGAGATSPSQQDALAYARRKGVFVVLTTRTGGGRVVPQPDATAGGGDHARRQIDGEDLAPVKARILLMLALALTSSPAEIQRMFKEY